MSRSIDGLELFFKTILDMQPANYDATALPFPFRPEERSRVKELGKLSFGVIRTDGIRTVHPPIQRALSETVEALTKAGHEGMLARHIVGFKLMYCQWSSSRLRTTSGLWT